MPLRTKDPETLDADVLRRARAGDHSAFARLLRQHDARLRGLAFSMLGGDAHAMDDVLQDAYIKAYRSLPGYREGAALGTWLYRIVYNACVDELRRTHRRPDPVDTREPDWDRPSGAPGPDAFVGPERAVRALAALPADQRVTMVLVDGEGFSHDDARDPFVARTLATLAVPEHAPDFWDRLEAALDDIDAPRPEGAEHPPHISLAGIVQPDEERRRRPSRLARVSRPLLAAAAVVLVVAAVRVSVADDDVVLQSATGAGSASSGPAPTLNPGTSTAVTTGAPRAEATLASFLDALGSGRREEAAQLIGPRSEAYLVAQNGSLDAFLIQASEGFGAWAASTDRVFTTVAVSSGHVVVVVEGTIAPEGMVEHRIDAFAMTKAESAQSWFVDMWAFDPAVGGRLELSVPASGDGRRELRVGEPVEIFAQAPGAVRFALAGRAPVDVATVKRGAANVATWTPAAADAGNERLLTVAFTSDSGAIFTALAVDARVG